MIVKGCEHSAWQQYSEWKECMVHGCGMRFDYVDAAKGGPDNRTKTRSGKGEGMTSTERIRALRLTDEELAGGIWTTGREEVYFEDGANAQFDKVIKGLIEIAEEWSEGHSWKEGGFSYELQGLLREVLTPR